MKVKPILASVVLCGALIVGMTGCASAGRSIKTFSSEMGGGLQREVIVYDATGQEIFHQTGKFDIEENEAGTKVLYDDENGMRHIIFLGSGTAIINEVD